MSDSGFQFRIGGTSMAEEPAPKFVILAFEQAFEPCALGRFRSGPAAIEKTFEQTIELAHAAPATPAQALVRGVFAHAAKSVRAALPITPRAA
jgi:hypothetical protein